MTLREYIVLWQEAYDKHQAGRPPMRHTTMCSKTTFSPAWEIYRSLN